MLTAKISLMLFCFQFFPVISHLIHHGHGQNLILSFAEVLYLFLETVTFLYISLFFTIHKSNCFNISLKKFNFSPYLCLRRCNKSVIMGVEDRCPLHWIGLTTMSFKKCSRKLKRRLEWDSVAEAEHYWSSRLVCMPNQAATLLVSLQVG